MSVYHKQILLLLDILAYTIALFITTLVALLIHSKTEAYGIGIPDYATTFWVMSFVLLLPVYLFLMTASNMYVYWRRIRDEKVMIGLVIFISLLVLSFGGSISLYIEESQRLEAMTIIHYIAVSTFLGLIWFTTSLLARRVGRWATSPEKLTIVASNMDTLKRSVDICDNLYKDGLPKYVLKGYHTMDGSEGDIASKTTTELLYKCGFQRKHRSMVALVVVDNTMTTGDMDVINFAKSSFLEVILIHKMDSNGTNDDVNTLKEQVTSSMFLLGGGWHKVFRKITKSILNTIIAITVAVVVLPLIIALMIIIKLDSKGAPLYKHRRVGKYGQDIDVLKLRTMHTDSYERLAEILATDENMKREWETNRKLKNDPRVTRVGKIIRKLSLDELPQIFNVIGGTMSLVGPRPVTRDELDNIYKDKGFYYKLVKPGITGYWQINGRNNVSYEQRILMDIAYVQKNSLLLDGAILLTTPFRIITNKGS